MIQLIVVSRIDSCIWCAPAKVGAVVWVNTQEAARHLIEHGFCKLPEVQGAGGGRRKKKPLRRSDSWPLDRFAVVERVWEGETVVCVGGGPSVTAEAVALARDRARVIAINNSYLLAPWADVCYFADGRWWEWHKAKPEFMAFAGQKVTIEGSGLMVADPEVYMLHNFGSSGISEKQNGLHTGSNSGYQAINLAVLAGAKRVLLLGYDMRFQDGRSHWHGDHPIKVPENNYRHYAALFGGMVPQLKRLGVEVVNCTPESAIAAFRFGAMDKELA